MKTSELTSAALDWAVAKCEGYEAHVYCEHDGKLCFQSRLWSPSTDWEQGGPIIERERIGVSPCGLHWGAGINDQQLTTYPYEGNTPLIAAMRCFVALKLGGKVKVPEKYNTVGGVQIA